MISICLWKMASVAQGSNGKMVSFFFSVPKIRQIHDFLSFILKNFHHSLIGSASNCNIWSTHGYGKMSLWSVTSVSTFLTSLWTQCLILDHTEWNKVHLVNYSDPKSQKEVSSWAIRFFFHNLWANMCGVSQFLSQIRNKNLLCIFTIISPWLNWKVSWSHSKGVRKSRPPCCTGNKLINNMTVMLLTPVCRSVN